MGRIYQHTPRSFRIKIFYTAITDFLVMAAYFFIHEIKAIIFAISLTNPRTDFLYVFHS